MHYSNLTPMLELVRLAGYSRAVAFAAISMILLLTLVSPIFAAPTIQESPATDDADIVEQDISALDVELVLAVAESREESGDHEGALRRYAEALDLAQSIGDSGQLVFILDKMGRLQRDVEKYTGSNRSFTELLTLQESLNDNDVEGTAETLSLIGANYAALGQQDKALEALEAATEQVLALDDTQLALSVLATIADVHQQGKAYQDALDVYAQALEIAESVDELAEIAEILEKIGNVQQDMKSYRESNETLNELMTMQEDIGDLRGVAKTLSLLSMNYAYLGQDDEASAALDQAVQLSLEADEPDRALSALRAATRVYEKEKMYDSALAAHSLALEIAETISDTAKITDSLADIGSIQRKMEAYEASTETLEELLALQDEIADNAGASKTLSLIGANHAALGGSDKAILAFEDSAERAVEAGDIKQAMASFDDLATVYADTGAYDEGIQVYQTALSVATDQGAAEQAPDVLRRMGRLQRKAKKYAESNETFAALLLLQEKADNLSGQVGTLMKLGANHADMGDTKAANSMFDRSTQIALSINNAEQAVNAFHAKADLYRDLGQYLQESEQYAAALSIASESREWLLAAESAEKMAKINYKNLQRNDEAIAAYEQASELYRRAGDRAAQTSALMNVAKLLGIQQQIDEALAVYDRVIQVSRTTGQLELEVEAQTKKGDMLRRQKRTEEALEVLELALSRAYASSDQMLAADALQYIAKLYSEKRYYEEALEAYQQILDITAIRPDIDLETKTRRNMWTILMRTQQVAAAYDVALGGSGITEPAEGQTVSGSVRISALAQHPEFRKWQLDLLIEGDEESSNFLAFGERPVWGKLATWDSTAVPNGKHALRLRVVRTGGNYDEYFTPITVQN